MSLLIKNGNVFYQGKFSQLDIYIKDDKIKEISDNLNKDCKTIDAAENYVIPGLIDIHVHFRDFELSYKEDWKSASMAAAVGGVTSAFDMPNNKMPFVTVDRIKEKLNMALEKSIINFGAYIAVTDKNIEEINNSNLKIVKLYYGETTGKINPGNTEKIFEKLRKDILIVVHAEERGIVEKNKEIYDKSDKKYHSLVRDNKVEYTAVNYILDLTKKYDRRIHITHVSCKESMELIINAKKNGLKITCDTCPHYLILDDSLYEKIGNFAKVNPALKSKKDREFLWKCINEEEIDCICSDHAPHTKEEKSLSYEKCAAGFPGVQTTSQLMLNAVNEKKIQFEKFVEMMTVHPIKILGIQNKGIIQEGFDADLCIIDLSKVDIINKENQYSKSKRTPFEGYKTKGKVITTIVNGNIVYDNEKFYDGIKGKEVILI